MKRTVTLALWEMQRLLDLSQSQLNCLQNGETGRVVGEDEMRWCMESAQKSACD